MIKRQYQKFKSGQGVSGVFYTISAYALWGVLPIYWKAMKQVPPKEILAHRIFWSFLLLISVIVTGKKWKDFIKAFYTLKTALAVVAGSLLISINWLLYIWAVNNNHIVEASLGYYINPLFTILLGIIVLKEKPDVWQMIAIAIAGAGVAFMTFEYNQVPWVALTLAVSFGLYGLVKKLSKLGSLNGLAAETMVVAPFALVYLWSGFMESPQKYIQLPWHVNLLILLSGVATSIPLLLFSKGAKRVSLSTLGFAQYLSPSISLVLGIFLYREPFTSTEKISFGCIWAALAIYSFTRKEFFRKKTVPEI
ncbi:MAG: EamA family transporter RarD [Bacteroidales bacterium]